LLRAAFGAARIARALDTGEALRVAAAEGDDAWSALPSVELRQAGDALEVQTPTAMLGYLDDVEASDGAFVERDGKRWLRAFDVETVDAAALERAIATTPGVREAAVLQVGSGGAERLHAFVAGDAAAVARHPARVITLETLPHRADGTIDREALRRMAATD
ncbi:MAG: o-succinylbenzoate--CoA ligase, partial [bacterium]|nr:o-succinylbenzoate--CoA ligase [bacterium]